MTLVNKTSSGDLETSIQVFVEGFSSGRARHYPCESFRVENIWCLRDALRKRAADYRKEEWVSFRTTPEKLHRTAKEMTRGRYFLCPVYDDLELLERDRAAFKQLGYRLLSGEQLFVHKLMRIPTAKSPARIELLRTDEQAKDYARFSRTKALEPDELDTGKFRQFLARVGDSIVGNVRSVTTGDGSWCSNLFVTQKWRRKGIGRALMTHLLRDDRKRGFRRSVLLASHTGAMLYPLVGYTCIGKLMIYAPASAKRAASR
jgi:GNAT superfamily N-acetyltransferase